MGRILDVPYHSQWDEDASKSATDSGPACLAMVLGYLGKHVRIDELYRTLDLEPNAYVGFGKLQEMARAIGFSFQYGSNHRLKELKQWIDQNKPVIALVKYSYWSQIESGVSTQSAFTGPQFVVVVGYGDGNIYVNDPNYWPPRRLEGMRKGWTEVLFNLAWSNVRVPNVPNPNNSVIVPAEGRPLDVPRVMEARSTDKVLEYTVQPGDTWSGLAGKFLKDQSRYPELLAFNNLSAGAPLFVGQRLRIPRLEDAQEDASPGHPIVLGEGATQIVEADIVRDLKTKWVREGRLAASADRVTVLRTFVEGIARWEPEEAPAIEYVVQPGDTWSGIAGRFLDDQTRFPEIIAFNQLPADAALRVGQSLRIPPK